MVRWLAETSEKVTHQEDVGKLRWLDQFLGDLMLDQTTLDVLDRIKAEKLKTASKPSVNRHLAVIRAILRRARDECLSVGRAVKRAGIENLRDHLAIAANRLDPLLGRYDLVTPEKKGDSVPN